MEDYRTRVFLAGVIFFLETVVLETINSSHFDKDWEEVQLLLFLSFLAGGFKLKINMFFFLLKSEIERRVLNFTGGAKT